eukprot:COSAG03_NODE_3367_length_2056_cov_13.128769_3_plen_166_part_00
MLLLRAKAYTEAERHRGRGRDRDRRRERAERVDLLRRARLGQLACYRAQRSHCGHARADPRTPRSPSRSWAARRASSHRRGSGPASPTQELSPRRGAGRAARPTRTASAAPTGCTMNIYTNTCTICSCNWVLSRGHTCGPGYAPSCGRASSWKYSYCNLQSRRLR